MITNTIKSDPVKANLYYNYLLTPATSLFSEYSLRNGTPIYIKRNTFALSVMVDR